MSKTSILSTLGAVDVIEDRRNAMAGRIAIIVKLAKAHAAWHQPGIDRELDADFWNGVEDLERQNRQDLAAIASAVDVLHQDAKGGAR